MNTPLSQSYACPCIIILACSRAEVLCACADLGFVSKFCTVMPYSATFPYQALAASWASFCSQKLGQEHLQLDFLNLHVFHTMQYGFDFVDHQAWQLEHPCKPEHTMLETAFDILLQKQAPRHYPKPGGWYLTSWSHDKLRQEHKQWCALLKPVIARYCVLYELDSLHEPYH